MEIKSLARIKEKWIRVTPQRAEDYKLGIQNPKRDQSAAAIAAKETHKAAMVQAGANDSFAKGLAKAGTAKWSKNSLQKGPGRFAEGVMVGGDDFEKGFAPARDILEKTLLPQRFPRRDPRNLQRVAVGNLALAKMKTG
jgi:hypothetical protein